MVIVQELKQPWYHSPLQLVSSFWLQRSLQARIMEGHDFTASEEHGHYQTEVPPSDIQWNGSYHRQLTHILQDLRSIWHFFLARISEVSEQIPAEESRKKKDKLCRKMSLAGVMEYTTVLYVSKPTWWDSFQIISHTALWQPATSRPCISRWFK